MENEEELSSRRPSIGFPLGLALLLLLLFCISALLLCYFNWHKLQTLIFGSSDHDDSDDDIESNVVDRSSEFQDSSPVMKPKEKTVGQTLLVLMAGEKVPRFIAMACPCEPPRTAKIAITVSKPPTALY
ncbi:Detected protein of unknown function [Hibiscus syriacus]|uniref:Hydroxyproline-rich glycoprotein family protein n=1 Tax=Hibiscus syriacus TaxID=106335 RepID=A0A6A2Z383_HIBSY|nr:uncharacterized protein At5g65660-like [Hibiscus syriacus]KAE8686187.1 Detected protein of unknown function [Hibiscus syriacus]